MHTFQEWILSRRVDHPVYAKMRRCAWCWMGKSKDSIRSGRFCVNTGGDNSVYQNPSVGFHTRSRVLYLGLTTTPYEHLEEMYIYI